MRTIPVAAATISLCLTLAGIPAAAQSPTVSGRFEPTGPPAEFRFAHTATALPDGRVLVIGGLVEDGAIAGAEVWDPATETFGAAGSLGEARAWHTATLDDGRVLMVGGFDPDDHEGLASAEVWDPTTETSVPVGSPALVRATRSATRLADGRVLVIGWLDEGGAIAGAEVWDPVAGTWEPAGSLTVASDAHTAMLLADDRVLVIGGNASGSLTSAEIWDPATASFAPAAVRGLARGLYTATLLADGRVLFIDDTDRFGEPIAAQIWDPATGAMEPTGTLAVVRAGHTATLLADGRVLVVGGWDPANDAEGELASAEIWDPATGTFSPAGSLAESILRPTLTALPDGRALVVGVSEPESHVFTSAAETWEPEGDN